MEKDTLSLRNDFFDNGLEIVNDIENTILKIEEEKNPEPEDLNSLFRSFHTLKGNSGIVGEKELNELFHVIESQLEPIRKGKQKIEEPLIENILDTCDLLKEIFTRHDSSLLKTEIERKKDHFTDYNPTTQQATKENREHLSSISIKPYQTKIVEITPAIFRKIIDTFSLILESLKDLDDNNQEIENLDLFDNIAVKAIEFRTVVLDNFSWNRDLQKLSGYLEELMFLINRNSIQYEKISFEILYSIINDIKGEILKLANELPFINRIPVISENEIDKIKNHLKENTWNIVEFYIPSEIFIKNLERINNLYKEKTPKYKIGFLNRYFNTINKLTSFINESVEDFPVIQKSYFAVLRNFK